MMTDLFVLQSPLRRRLSKIPLYTWAIFIFWLFPFLSIVSASRFLPGFERFGLQWHVLLLSCLVSASLVLLDETFFNFLRRLFSIHLISLVALVFVIWLATMGLIHGFFEQSESLSSAAICLLMVPVSMFLVCQFRSRRVFILVPLFLLSFLVFFESLFLTNYLFLEQSFNIVESSGSLPPRLFLNTRDGNFLSLVQFLFVFLTYVSTRVVKTLSLIQRRLSWLFLGLFSFFPFYNAWLTQGRALLLSAMVGILLALLFAKLRGNLLYKQFGFISLAACLLSFFAVQVVRFQASLTNHGQVIESGGVAPLLDFVDRADGGRFDVWRLWIDSGLSNSLWWGHGLGQLPSVEPLPVMTPHNLIIQILADGGICSLFISFVILLVIGWKAHVKRLFQPLDFCILCPLIVYSNLGNILFWPSGVWSLSLLLIAYIWSKVSSEAFVAPMTSAAGSLCSKLSVSSITILYAAALIVTVSMLSSAKYFSLWSVIPLQVTN